MAQRGGVRSRSLLRSRGTRKSARPEPKGYKAHLLSFLISISADLEDKDKSPVEKLGAVRTFLKRILQTYERAVEKRSSGELISQLDIVFALLSSKLLERLRAAAGLMNSKNVKGDTFEGKLREIIEDTIDLESEGSEFIKEFIEFLEEFEEFAEDEDTSAAVQGDADALSATIVEIVYTELRSQFTTLMSARQTSKRSTRRIESAISKKPVKTNQVNINVNNLGNLFSKMKTG